MMKRRINRLNKETRTMISDSSCVTLKDLCQQDKQRVKKLVEDLAIVGTEKEEIDQIRKKEKYQYEMKLYNLQRMQMKLSEENKSLEESLKKHRQELKDLQKNEKKESPQETYNPNSFKLPPTHLPTNPHPPSVSTVPVPPHPCLEAQPYPVTAYPQPTPHYYYSHRPHTLYPPLPPYLAPQLHQLYQSYPPLFSYNHPSLSLPHQQPLYMQHDQHGGTSVGDRSSAVRNTPPAMTVDKQHDKVTSNANTTWCTLPESEYVAVGHSQFGDSCVERAMPGPPQTVCESNANGVPVHSRTTAKDLSHIETFPHDSPTTSEAIRQSTPAECACREKNSVVNRTETVSTQTDGLQLAPSSAQQHERETSLAMTKYKLSAPNTPVNAPRYLVTPVSNNSRHVVHVHTHQELSPLCWDNTVTDHEIKETELLSKILNDSPLSLDGLSISLIDASEEQYQDDEQLIKDVFYIT